MQLKESISKTQIAHSRKRFLLNGFQFIFALSISKHLNFLPYSFKLRKSLNINEANLSGFSLLDSMGSFKIIQDFNSNCIQIIAHEIVLNDRTQIPKDKNLALFAYRIIVEDGINLNGKNLFMLANVFELKNSQIIDLGSDVNGKDFSEVFQPSESGASATWGDLTAKNADNLTTSGIQEDLQGGGRMNGKNGGDLFINFLEYQGNLTLKSKGGDGGTGEIGQSGRPGKDASGGNASMPNREILNRWNGGCLTLLFYGYPGENGGSGALGGWGEAEEM